MPDLTGLRIHPLATIAASSGAAALGGVALSAAPAASRYILRGEATVSPAGAVLGLTIPTRPCTTALVGDHAALWLGPDEWLLLLPAMHDTTSLAAALTGIPCSLVDVSHRQTAIILEGPGAADTLNAAVPMDLSNAAFPVGMCVRTIFEKAEIVLWRTGLDRFHVEVWRSFGPYVWELLDLVRTENAAL